MFIINGTDKPSSSGVYMGSRTSGYICLRKGQRILTKLKECNNVLLLQLRPDDLQSVIEYQG